MYPVLICYSYRSGGMKDEWGGGLYLFERAEVNGRGLVGGGRSLGRARVAGFLQYSSLNVVVWFSGPRVLFFFCLFFLHRSFICSFLFFKPNQSPKELRINPHIKINK